MKNYEEEEVFVPTCAYKQIKDELESSYFITVTGRPGDGKTTIAIRLLIEYSKNKRTCFICQTPENWEAIAGLKGRKVAVMVDDVFGTYVYDEMKSKPWISRFETMERIIKGSNGNIYIIFTSRFYIIEQIKPFLDKTSLFKSQYIINLSHKEFELSKFEKEDILNKHLQLNNYKLDESTIKRISYTCAPHGFPHCAKLFTSSFFLYQQGLSFFKNPIECLNSEIERFRLSDKNKFCVLALMAMEGGKLTETFLNDMNPKHEQTKTLIRVCGLPDNTPFSIMKEALICMNTVYVRQVPDGSFVFHHETVSEAVCYSLSKSNLEFALRYMDLKFINKRIKTQAWKKGRDVLAICIPHNMYPMLWRRLYTEIEKNNLKQCMKHQAWEDREFLLATSGKSQNDTNMDKSLSDLVKMICCARSFFYWAVFYRKETIVSTALQNFDINVRELSQALVTACGKGLSLPVIQNILEKEPNLEYIETASEYRKYENDDYENNDSEYSDIDDVLDILFGEKLASLFQQGGITALQAAIFSRKIEIVKLLLKHGSKISTKQKMGRTALHFASAINDFDIQKYLLESLSLCPSTDKQRLINDVDKKGRTALHYAKSKDMMILLIHWEANPNSRDACGHTPLLYRAKYGITYDMVEALCIVGKADINAVDNARRNVLHIALRIDRGCDIVKCILTMAKLGLNFNCRTYDGETPLMCFVKRYAQPNLGWHSKAKIIQTLTECGANLNVIDSQELTALHYSIISMDQSKTVNLLLNGADPIVSCFFGCPLRYLFYHFSKLDKNMDLNRILNMMIKFMPDINYSITQGKTLLHLILQCDITSSRMEELVNMVLQKGININAKDANGVTPLMMAATKSCKILKLIIENHGILNDIDNEGRHALFHVAYEKCSKFDIVDFLLERGLSLNDRDENGKTPLHSLLSSKHCTVECIKFYISRGANVCLKDDSGKSAIHHLCSKKGVFAHCSSECDAKKMLETLVEHRADLNNIDNEGNTPLMHSCKNNTDSKVLKYLLSRNDVQKTNTNKEGQNILHLIMNYSKEDDIMAVIEMLQEQHFDFNVEDNHSKSSLVYAIEKNYLSLTLELLSVTNVLDDYKTTLTICHAVIESDVLNKLSKDNSSEFASKELQNIFTKLSDRRFHSLMRIFPKAVTLTGGKNFPHLLVKSNINDDVLNYIFSLIIRQHRVSLTMTDNVGRTVLHFAIQYYKGDLHCRRISVIRLLLQQGANPNQRDVEGRTALHYCVQSSRCDNEAKEIMQCLLEHGGDPFLVNKKGKLAFELITDTVPRLRTIKCIKKMFTIPSEKLQVTQWKALRSFAGTRDIVQSDVMHIVSMVLNTWSFDFISDNKTKILHLACKYCNYKLANVLFMLPGEVDIEDADGKTPLQLLITSERIQQEVQYLDESLDKWASYYDKMEMLELRGSFTLQEAVLLLKGLLQRSADPNTRDSDGNTPLHLLLTSGWYGKYVWEAASVLLSYGADVNAVNAKGVTPLMLAASHKRIEIRAVLIYILMKHGACVLTKDVNEKDALWYSQRNISEYVRASSHNTSFTSMCATSTEAYIVRSFLMSQRRPDDVEFDELCSDDHVCEWL